MLQYYLDSIPKGGISMCGKNYSDEERLKYFRLGRYSALILQGETIEKIAADEGKAPEKIMVELESIKDINPVLYYQICSISRE